jgi:CheY-like chemotaxis protein
MRLVELLLADDDMDDRSLFETALQQLNFKTRLTLASDGEQLLNQLHHQEPPPDVLFLDLNMPRKNGLQCLKEMKESPRLSRIPVIIYSTSIEETAVEHLYNEGAFLYIQKPGKFSSLKDAIQKALDLTLEVGAEQLDRSQFVLKL